MGLLVSADLPRQPDATVTRVFRRAASPLDEAATLKEDLSSSSRSVGRSVVFAAVLEATGK